MKTEQEYIKDLSDIRQMMEKSTKFLSLAGWSGIMAGVYALAGAYLIYRQNLFFANQDIFTIRSYDCGATPYERPVNLNSIITIAISVLILAVTTCIFLSYRKARKNNEVLWSSTTRRLVFNMAIPLVTGGLLILLIISERIFGLVAPLTLIFYGLGLVNASRFTFDELRYMGIFEIVLGLISITFINYSLVFWAIGFGVLHIIYGIYMHWRYER